MSGLRFAVSILVALCAAGIGVPAPVAAQDTANAHASSTAPCRLCRDSLLDNLNARPTGPLRLEVESRLDFDKVVFNGGGGASLALSPGGAATLTGAATAAGARAMPGTIVVHGEPGRAIRVDLPGRVILHGAGSGSIELDRLVTDLPSFPRIGEDGTLSFHFGGDLRLAGDSDGAYHGTIDIIVEYL
jgi:Domain of unknown function (DUF4402)